MQRLAGHAATKKKHVLKNASSRTATNLVSGIPKTSVRSCGIFSTVVRTRASTSVYSQSVTGPKWMFGITSGRKTFLFHHYILLTKEKLFTVTIHGCRYQN